MRISLWLSLVLGLVAGIPRLGAASPAVPVPPPPPGFVFIDTGFENASPLHWDVQTDGTVLISLLYDHERASPNRAAGHWHFRLEGAPDSAHVLELRNFDNVWNGRRGSPIDARTACVVSDDGRVWRHVPAEYLGPDRVRLRLTVGRGGVLHVARIEPYRVSDLDTWLAGLRRDPRVAVAEIGRTVAGRPLEIVRIGRETAPHRVFLRARAHPWEPGGNWVLQGLARALLAAPPATGAPGPDEICFYFLPMANKDGVALGRTRFNLRGVDLNRGWDRPAPAELAPENHALEQWLAAMAARGLRPHFALELHNDNNGRLHVSRPDVPGLAAYLENMTRFEALLRKHTWFTEGSTGSTFRNPGTLGDGWLERFGIPAAVLEFNAHWIAGKKRPPLGADWEEFGAALPAVFAEYFSRR